MKLVTFAAGVAAGYVLGSRAGRETYEKIVANARKVSADPRVVQAQEKAKSLVGTGADAVTAKLAAVSAGSAPAGSVPVDSVPADSVPVGNAPAGDGLTASATAPVPRPTRRTPVVPVGEVPVDAPLI